MTLVKLTASILYLFLAYVGITRPMTLEANLSLGVLAVLAVVHLVECAIFRDMIRRAPGGAAWNAFNVFLFGVFHMQVMKASLQDGEPGVGVEA